MLATTKHTRIPLYVFAKRTCTSRSPHIRHESATTTTKTTEANQQQTAPIATAKPEVQLTGLPATLREVQGILRKFANL